MMKCSSLVVILLFCYSCVVCGQEIYTNEQFVKADISYVLYDLDDGKLITQHNSSQKLVPASILKIHTMKMALDKLGKEFKFKTEIFLDGYISDYSLNGNVIIKGYGDPTLNSSLPQAISKEKIIAIILRTLKKHDVHCVNGKVIIDASYYQLPGISPNINYQDAANYYGAGIYAVNWNENTYKVDLIRNKNGVVELGKIHNAFINNAQLNVRAKGRRDLAYIYPGTDAHSIIISGTVPEGTGSFTIKGAIKNPPLVAANEISNDLERNGISISNGYEVLWQNQRHSPIKDSKTILTSPSLEKIGQEILFESNNLYAESLFRYLNRRDSKSEPIFRVVDGSGLSPVNRITANQLIDDLKAIHSSKYFDEFLQMLPQNGKEGTVRSVIKSQPGIFHVKSGSMTSVNAYAGYATSKDGHDLAFVVMVNNFEGSYAVGKKLCMSFLNFVAKQ